LTTEKIIQMAFELGNAISQSEEIESLQTMQIKLSEDPEATSLINYYQEARTQIEHKAQEGLQIMPEEEKKLESLQEQLNNNQTVKELIEVQERFNNLMQSVYFALNQAISGESCSSDCSSCGGSCAM